MRPLYDDGASKAQEATRDYVLKADHPDGQAPVINIFGGKITTYRRLAEHMLEKIEHFLGKKGKSWTARRAAAGRRFLRARLRRAGREAEGGISVPRSSPRAPPDPALRHARQGLLGLAKSQADLGTKFGPDLYEAEVRYLIDHEWAVTADDVLWRRTKRGLTLSREEAAALDEYMKGIKPGLHTRCRGIAMVARE